MIGFPPRRFIVIGFMQLFNFVLVKSMVDDLCWANRPENFLLNREYILYSGVANLFSSILIIRRSVFWFSTFL